MNRPEEKVRDTLDGGRANARLLVSSQFYTPESKKTYQVDMDDLTPPAPAVGVTCAPRVSLSFVEGRDEQREKHAASDMIIPLSGWTAASLDSFEFRWKP